MIILRDQQVEAFEDARMQSFEDRMFPHIRREFPSQVESLGEAETREVICSGIEVAAQYGIESEQDVGQYIMLMFVHDFDFDESSETPWANEILTRPGLSAPERLNALWERTTADAGQADEDDADDARTAGFHSRA
jgi:hypothetical protein